MTKDEALKLALEALETGGWNKTTAAITALRERLAKPEQTISMTEYKRLQDLVTSQGIRLMEYDSAHPKQEPFCYHDGRNIVGKEFADHSDVFPLYTSPQPRQWIRLSDAEIHNMTILMGFNPEWVAEVEIVKSIVRNLEAKLKEKNA